MTLAEELEKWGVNASEEKGVVTLEAQPDNLDDLCDEGGTVKDPAFSAFLDRLDTFQAYLSAHPEGSDRGGYVVWVEDPATGRAAFYYEPACEWSDR